MGELIKDDVEKKKKLIKDDHIIIFQVGVPDYILTIDRIPNQESTWKGSSVQDHLNLYKFLYWENG